MLLSFVVVCITVAEPAHFAQHVINSFPAGYQLGVADINGDGCPDVVALSTEADCVDWFENPGWQRHPVARTDKNVDLAVRDINKDGHPVIALASGAYFSESNRGGEIQLLRPPSVPGELWPRQIIAVNPIVHRLRWGDVDGDGRPELIHAPIQGAGAMGVAAPKPAHLWAFRMPQQANDQPWDILKIDESLTILHGICVADLDGDGRDEVLTASYEGIHRFDWEGPVGGAQWRKVQLSTGAPPLNDQPGSPRGTSDVAPFRLAKDRFLLAAIEPYHGNSVIVYSPPQGDGPWQRRAIDESLHEGHALAVGDFDDDGMDEIVAGWRENGGGLRLYKAADSSGQNFRPLEIDAVPAECVVAADINGDNKQDLVVSAGRTNQILWYEGK